ncbi:hypothetical protein SAMN02746041_01664 [Desulfacinum hydrothermale DSM 13146]|uniref:Uncharacterized protein n=1 Tax=Desulfacinum hydrothermale DSM 13146 TaxID=1121390 RepID=A0A1W1XH85_9BACT|nr:hypothetical protein [Desulfacinum hydrothermale]SMC23134.1 hypothetical protein SAMN02746041_01664 [Desulfacinum hydrothermale DSM 13146]
MATKGRLAEIFASNRHPKIILGLTVAFLLVLEVLIYLTAASQAGERSRIIITDPSGAKVYETTGSTLTSYEKMVFESTFGPLERYRIHLQTENRPFPFRAWLSAAIGIPVGLVLLISFSVKAFLSLLYGEDGSRGPQEGSGSPSAGALTSFWRLLDGVSIFHVGFLVLLAVLIFWMLPNFLGDLGRVAAGFLKEYKWLVLGGAAFLAAVLIWVIYLRYRLSKQVLQNQMEIEKLKIEQMRLLPTNPSELLSAPQDETGTEG